MKIKSFEKLDLKNHTVLVRVDYNVPLKGLKIQDDSRIKETLPTLRLLLKKQAKIILISHLGRPEGKSSKALSLEPIAKHLQKLLGKSSKQKLLFIKNFQSSRDQKLLKNLQRGQIALLENIRFWPEEEQNNLKFSKELAQLGSIYINDAFAAAHRKHASTYQLGKLLPAYGGLLIKNELAKLSPLIEKKFSNATLIVGGAKIDTKIGLIKTFIPKTKQILIGGGLANTFLKAQKYEIGASLVENDKLKIASQIINKINKSSSKLFLPKDLVVAKKLSNQRKTSICNLNSVKANDKILDLGPQTIKQFEQAVSKSKLIIWNGPLGVYEFKPFRQSTKAIANAIAKATKNGATTILGGGDTLDALKVLKISTKKFTHCSTAGGAMLEFLEGKKLPGLEIISA
jgi:phosphoglycerate kinase